MAQSQWTANGTAAADGTVSIKFPTLAVNSEFSGNVCVPQAPTQAQWLVYINDVAVSSLGGNASYGTLQVRDTDVLRLVGSGLAPGTQYQGVLTGNLVYGTSAPVIPTPTASSVVAASIQNEPGVIASGSVASSGIGNQASFAIPVGPTVRTLTIVVTGTGTATLSGQFAVYGSTSALEYRTVPYLQGSNSPPHEYIDVVEIVAGLDSSIQVDTFWSAGTTVTYQVFADSIEVDERQFYTGVPIVIAESSNTPGTTTIVTGPRRILAVTLTPGTNVAQINWGGDGLIVAPAATIVLPLPANTLLEAGQTIDLLVVSGTAFSTGSVLSAYP